MDRGCSAFRFGVCACVMGVVLGLAPGRAAAQICIGTIEDLQRIGHYPGYPLDGDYVLVEDIDASATADWNDGAGFEPIGTYSYGNPSTAFTGHFDGQGHTIVGLTINRPTEDYIGLFGCVGDDGQVINVGFLDGAVTGDDHIGGLVGFVYCGAVSPLAPAAGDTYLEFAWITPPSMRATLIYRARTSASSSGSHEIRGAIFFRTGGPVLHSQTVATRVEALFAE